jgi:uncharacterized protein YbjT (DUF2867 family)
MVADLVLVTGGSGTLGREVVRRLLAGPDAVRVLSRRRRPDDAAAAVEWVTGDLTTGRGLHEAVRGASSVVHCASDVRRPRRDIEGTQRLLAAARSAGRPHLVYVSIVGVDRVPLGYYRTKLAVEQRVRDGGLPWTILRATQFHQLVLSALRGLARSPVMLVPAATSVQPVDPAEVAVRLVGLADGPAAGRVPDFGGPHVRTFVDLARCYLDATHRRRLLLPARIPGRVAAGYRRGGHLAPQHADGRKTFEEFLSAAGGRA